jgi:hypothetical protein
MGIDFWYTNIMEGSGVREMIEKMGLDIRFKNVDTDTIDPDKLNFLVFVWETSPKLPYTTYTISDEFLNLLSGIQHQNFYFMGDFSREAHQNVDKLSVSFLNALKSKGINTNRLIVVKNDSSRIGIHKIRYDNFTLNTFFFPHFFLSTYNHMNRYIVDTDIKKTVQPDKEFLCLNRRMYHHKYKIIEELFNRGLLKDTRFTWVDNFVPTNKISKTLISELNINVDEFDGIQLEGDVMYGSRLSYHDEFLFTINPDWYYRSKVDIITETILDGDAIHITEKTFKAIYLGLPFVISASKGHLKALRDMGFKTFNSVINEDYDDMSGGDKIKKIIDSAIELASVWNSPEVVDICKFNQELYFNSEHRKQICKELFLDRLNDVKNLTIPKKII